MNEVSRVASVTVKLWPVADSQAARKKMSPKILSNMCISDC